MIIVALFAVVKIWRKYNFHDICFLLLHRIFLQNNAKQQLFYFVHFLCIRNLLTVFLVASLVAQRLKRLPAMQETRVRSLGWEDSPGEGNGNPLQYSCLENLMDREAG